MAIRQILTQLQFPQPQYEYCVKYRSVDQPFRAVPQAKQMKLRNGALESALLELNVVNCHPNQTSRIHHHINVPYQTIVMYLNRNTVRKRLVVLQSQMIFAILAPLSLFAIRPCVMVQVR